jgi:hypothetical protein
MQQHPQVPWVVMWPAPGGGYFVQDRRTGETAQVPDAFSANQFAAQRAAAPGHMGAGDMVHAVTKRLGIQQCSPCVERQAQLNRLMPKVWRR